MALNKKYDIFISYRHDHMKIIERLVYLLRRHYNVFWDQRLLSGYWEEQLETAIDNSSVVLINFTPDSLVKKRNDKNEDWFYREIMYSMAHKNPEQIIPVFHDGFAIPEKFNNIGALPEEMETLETLCNKHQGVRDISSLFSIVKKIRDYLEALGVKAQMDDCQDDDSYLIIPPITPTVSFKGREKELKDISYLLEENDVLFISGMGGIGKTELAKKVMEEVTGEYQCVFCKYEGSPKATLERIKINGIMNEEFKDKELALKKLLNKDVLLVIDNFDFEDEENADEYINELCTYSCKKLITTRNNFSDMEFDGKTAVVKVGNLADDELREIFDEKYGGELTDDQFKRILEFTGRLTLAIPIFASLCVKSGITVAELCEKVEKGLLAFEDDENVRYNKDGNHKGTIPQIIRVLFKIDDMNEEEKKTLCNLSLLQFMQVTRRIYKEFAFYNTKGNLNTFNSLVESNWIKEVPGSTPSDNCFELHPIINELIKADLKPSMVTSPEVFERIGVWFALLNHSSQMKDKAEENFILGLNVSVDENYQYIANVFLDKFYPLWRARFSKEVLRLANALINELEKRELYTDADAVIVAKILASANDVIDVRMLKTPIERCFKAEEVGRVKCNYLVEIINHIETTAVYYRKGQWKDYLDIFFDMAKKFPKYFSENYIESINPELSIGDQMLNVMEENIRGAESLSNACEMVKKAEDVFWLEYISFVIKKFLTDDSTEKDALDVLQAVLALTDDESRKKSIQNVFSDIYMEKALSCLPYEMCMEFLKTKKDRIYINQKLRAALMCDDVSREKEALQEFLFKDSIEKNAHSAERKLTFVRRSYFNYKVCEKETAEILYDYVKMLENNLSKDAASVSVIHEWYDLLVKIISSDVLQNEVSNKKEEYEKIVVGFELKKKSEQ